MLTTPRDPIPVARWSGWGCGAKKLRASEQEREDVAAARDAWRAEVCGGVDLAKLVLVDKSGSDTAMMPACARAPRASVPWAGCRVELDTEDADEVDYGV